MPKKGKGKGKGKDKKIVDISSLIGMSKEELINHTKRMREELTKEREERNLFQLERDRFERFLEINKSKLEEQDNVIRNLHSNIEETEERHLLELKIMKQKVKHIIFEREQIVERSSHAREDVLREAQDDHRLYETELRRQKRELKMELKELELTHEEFVKALKMEHKNTETELQEQYEQQLSEMETKFKEKLRVQRVEMDLRRKTELHQLEEQKNDQIHDLIKQHDKMYSDMRKYYNDIVMHGLNLIASLKKECETLKRNDEKRERRLVELLNENRTYASQVNSNTTELEGVNKKLGNLARTEAKLKLVEHKWSVHENEKVKLETEREIFVQRIEILEKERNKLYTHFLDSLVEVQQKMNLKNMFLEQKLVQAQKNIETKDVQLTELISACNLDPCSYDLIAKRIDETLDAKNRLINDLKFELARVCKAHHDLMLTYESRLKEFSIPFDQTGFVPFKSVYVGPNSHGPSGLVSDVEGRIRPVSATRPLGLPPINNNTFTCQK